MISACCVLCGQPLESQGKKGVDFRNLFRQHYNARRCRETRVRAALRRAGLTPLRGADRDAMTRALAIHEQLGYRVERGWEHHAAEVPNLNDPNLCAVIGPSNYVNAGKVGTAVWATETVHPLFEILGGMSVTTTVTFPADLLTREGLLSLSRVYQLAGADAARAALPSILLAGAK